MRPHPIWIHAIASLSLACSSSNFDVATPTPEDTGAESAEDTAALGDGAVDDAIEDTVIEDALPPSDAPCSPLAPSATTIFVDARTTRAPVGSAECPTKTIAQALAIANDLLAAKRTIKIAGTSGTPLVYNETSLLVVKGQTSIIGAGPGQVVISGGGACGATTCVVVLDGAGSIEGVTIKAGAAVGLALGPAAGATAIAKNMTVTGATNDASAAVYVNGAGAVILGPEFRATGNAGVGLMIETALSTKVHGSFNENGAGIVVKGGVLNIEGGQAQRNKTHGVSLLSNAKHTIANFDIRENAGNGIFVEANAHLKMRSSTVVKNRIGLLFRFGTANELDLGTLADNGKNLFGGGTSGYNSKAAICLPLTRATKAPAVGNKWLVCEPTRLPLVGGATCEGLSTYQDVYYTPITSGDPAPLDWSACDMGP